VDRGGTYALAFATVLAFTETLGWRAVGIAAGAAAVTTF
jgi:hypothetical protein